MDVTTGRDLRPTCWRVQLLGGFRLVDTGESVVLPRGGRRLVALLALRGDLHRAVVAGTLWPERTDRSAQGCLRTALWRVQRVVPGLVCVDDDRLVLDAGVEVDPRVLPAGDRRRARVDPVDDGRPVQRAEDLLPGWYDEWVVVERERCRQAALHDLEELVARLSGEGLHASAIQVAHRLLAAEPLRESAHRALIGAHLAEGNVVEARRRFDEACQALRLELGVGPSTDLTALMGRLPQPRPHPPARLPVG